MTKAKRGTASSKPASAKAEPRPQLVGDEDKGPAVAQSAQQAKEEIVEDQGGKPADGAEKNSGGDVVLADFLAKEMPEYAQDNEPPADTAIRALADLKQCVATAAQNKDALLFRLLPPPG